MTRINTYDTFRALARALGAAILMAVMFAFLGIYDTNNMPFFTRLSFWTVIMVGGSLLCFFTEPLVFQKLLKDVHPAWQVLAITILISIPITIFLMGLNSGFSFSQPFNLWGMQFIGVITISAIICAGRYMFLRILGRLNTAGQSDQSNASPTQSFLERLPTKFKTAQLYAVSSEGHYLRVHTDKGSPLILMRISDAVRELENADGLKVHRSWWVAKDGVEDIHKERGRRSLLLKNGEIAPVSRAHFSALKAAKLDR